MTPDVFLNILQNKDKEDVYKLGKVNPAHMEGRPSVIFDGENIPSKKKYPYLSSYTPKGSDRVLMLKVSGTYVILGKVI